MLDWEAWCTMVAMKSIEQVHLYIQTSYIHINLSYHNINLLFKNTSSVEFLVIIGSVLYYIEITSAALLLLLNSSWHWVV